jgi:hypothetical protein
MVEHICEKCNKVFNKKSTFMDHINRKNPCTDTGTQCKYCEREFSRRDYLKVHMEKCKLKNNKPNNKLTVKNSGSIDNIIDNSSNQGTIANTINAPVLNTTINININPFLGEDMSKLTEKEKKCILKKCYMSIHELIKQVHFNPKIPENHNVYISGIKSKYGHINDGNKWILTKLDQLIDDLINKKKDDIEDLLEEYEHDLPSKVVDKVRDVIATLEYDPLSDEEPIDKGKKKLKKQIMDEVKLLLYNNKEIPRATRAKQEKNNEIKTKK